MKRAKYTDEQIAFALKQAELGTSRSLRYLNPINAVRIEASVA